MNRLQYESSPYLLQHAHNPVDWYAWRPEAFDRAKRENKPILVSIGYATCHWCHVMERESFENEDVAAFMNAYFINIKVDREERPDVDAIYMEACQILSGSGGWPLNCFLTPEGKPFYAGTYYPPRAAYNKPGWFQLLQHLHKIWTTQPETALEQAEKLLEHIQRNDNVFVRAPDLSQDLGEREGSMTPKILENIFYRMRERFDRYEGGFGGAPKFPSTMAIQYLLQYHYFTGNKEALDQARLSLNKMIHGGIYDQLGGGFARYATDNAWLVPHFEKMLYDNALLVSVLSDAFQMTQDELYRETIEETLEYVSREMTHPDGGFYSAQDADSEGIEGKFFVWQKAEIDALLGADAPLFEAFYGVSEAGNWEHANILWREKTYAQFAGEQNLNEDHLKATLKKNRHKLFNAREKRIHPGLDDKIVLGWNALMISAYARAYNALGNQTYLNQAEQCMDFIKKNFADSEKGLFHVWKNGQGQYNAFLEDYAFVIAANIDLYEITFDLGYLRAAEAWTEHVLSHFEDAESGLFFFTPVNQDDIVLRKKDLYDNATPSGNSTMVHNLQRLGLLVDRPAWRDKAHLMLLTMRETVERYPLSFERWATALVQEIYPMLEIAVVGQDAYAYAGAIRQRYLPNKILAATIIPNNEIPLLAGKSAASNTFIYVCRDFICRQPVVSLEAFWEQVQAGTH